MILTGANTKIITKNGTDETTPEYDILYFSGPVFHGDSGSEVKIPIFCLWYPI